MASTSFSSRVMCNQLLVLSFALRRAVSLPSSPTISIDSRRTRGQQLRVWPPPRRPFGASRTLIYQILSNCNPTPKIKKCPSDVISSSTVNRAPSPFVLSAYIIIIIIAPHKQRTKITQQLRNCLNPHHGVKLFGLTGGHFHSLWTLLMHLLATITK